MERDAFLMMYCVSFVGLSFSQRSHTAATKWGRLLLASFSQFPTLSCTYLEGSALNFSNTGKYISGVTFNASICIHQTPRGRSASQLKRRILGLSLSTHCVISGIEMFKLIAHLWS